MAKPLNYADPNLKHRSPAVRPTGSRVAIGFVSGLCLTVALMFLDIAVGQWIGLVGPSALALLLYCLWRSYGRAAMLGVCIGIALGWLAYRVVIVLHGLGSFGAGM